MVPPRAALLGNPHRVSTGAGLVVGVSARLSQAFLEKPRAGVVAGLAGMQVGWPVPVGGVAYQTVEA